MIRFVDFQNRLVGLGLPVIGVGFRKGDFYIDLDNPTPEQEALAWSEFKTFDFRPRVFDRDNLRDWFESLNAVQKAKIQAMMIAWFCSERPDLISKIGIDPPFTPGDDPDITIIDRKKAAGGSIRNAG